MISWIQPFLENRRSKLSIHANRTPSSAQPATRAPKNVHNRLARDFLEATLLFLSLLNSD